MEITDGVLRIEPGLAATLGIIVLFAGKRFNKKVAFLRKFSIPKPVSGGLFFSIAFAIIYAATGVAVGFDLAARDLLLVYFLRPSALTPALRTY